MKRMTPQRLAEPASALGLNVLGPIMVGLTVLAGCTAASAPASQDEPVVRGSADASAEAEPDQPRSQPHSQPGTDGSVTPKRAPANPVSVPGLDARTHRGDRLTLGAVREETGAFTSYDVTYRSRSTGPGGAESLIISGVLNVPQGKGPFPAVVLAHGYIDPAIYVRGQGMTRERGFLADRGFLALHVDYRNHAESSDDTRSPERVRLGYSSDVINAVNALKATDTDRVKVDADRISLFGRSMGGGVVLKALIAEPGLTRAASTWASVSSREADNFNQFVRDDADERQDAVVRAHGLPEDSPRFWREVSSRPYLGSITEPVLQVHGRFDDTCPPAWARATDRALTRAGVNHRLVWYADGHAFGPAFTAAMERTVAFFQSQSDS